MTKQWNNQFRKEIELKNKIEFKNNFNYNIEK